VLPPPGARRRQSSPACSPCPALSSAASSWPCAARTWHAALQSRRSNQGYVIILGTQTCKAVGATKGMSSYLARRPAKPSEQPRVCHHTWHADLQSRWSNQGYVIILGTQTCRNRQYSQAKGGEGTWSCLTLRGCNAPSFLAFLGSYFRRHKGPLGPSRGIIPGHRLVNLKSCLVEV